MGGQRDCGVLSRADWDPRAMDDEVDDEWALPPQQDGDQEDDTQDEFADEVDEYQDVDEEEVGGDEEDETTPAGSCSSADGDGDDEFGEEFQEEEEDEMEAAALMAEVEAVTADVLADGAWGGGEWPAAEGGELHMYYSNLASLANVHLREPNLTVLSLIGQPLHSLAGVENLPHLRELWAVECELDDVSAVESCVSLEKLYLYSNRIRAVPNLESLPLRVLWLASNDITDLSPVAKVALLTELNASKNRLTSLVVDWSCCAQLSTVNLSANPVYMLTDLLTLREAPTLQNLQFADPMYGDSPVTQLCNYRSYVVHHVPSILCLEQLNVTEEERFSVDSFYAEKFLYYNMLRHHYKNLYMKEEKDYMTEYYKKIDSYKGYRTKYMLKNMWEGKRENPGESEATNWKMEHLYYKISLFDKDLKHWRKFHADSLETRLQQVGMEQQHAGNLRFRQFSGDCEPMVICQRLLDGYVCRHLRSETGIRGTELLEVTHITNKGLEVIANLRMGSKRRRSSTIMLLAPPGGLAKPSQWPFEVAQRGFVESGEYEVGVTNCLYYADQQWMFEAREARRRSSPALSHLGPADAQYARRVAVVALFARDTLLLPCQHAHEGDTVPTRDLTAEPLPARAFLPRGGAGGADSDRPCCTYVIANAQLVLSMIVLEFRYVYEDPLETFRQRMGWTSDVHEQGHAPPRHALGRLDEATLPAAIASVREAMGTSGALVAALSTLVLTGCGIDVLGRLPKMETVSSVNLSFNKLKSLRGLEVFCNVRDLDLSYNELTLSGAERDARPRLALLRSLDVSWNCAARLLLALPLLGAVAPQLSALDVRHNPVDDLRDHAHAAFFAKRHLRHLVRLDGEHIDDALQSKQDTGLNGVWGGAGPRGARREPAGLRWEVERRVAGREGRRREPSPSAAPPFWLCCRGHALTDVKLLERFRLVRWADFSRNLLDDVRRFLLEMPDLEELSLSCNVISEFPVLSPQWTRLLKLDLSRNYLKSIATFQCGCFPSLKLLDVSGNMLHDLNGIQACEELVECYAACNRISYEANVLPAKNCRVLRMLDLTGNPVEWRRDFRPFCVYHIRELEYLNGRSVEDSDVAEASDRFGGRLDRDFLLKTPHALELSALQNLVLVGSSIRKVNLPGGVLPNLERLDLSNNSITCLWGLHALPALKTLRLSYNQVSSMRPPSGVGPWAEADAPCTPTRSPTPASASAAAAGAAAPPFPALRMLLLDNNRLTSAKLLSLREMPQLSSLFLQQNELDALEGLSGMANLRFLVMDENKIQSIGAGECRGLAALEELWVEGNRLSQLCFAKGLRALRRLFLAGNCIADPAQLRHLAALEGLREVTLWGNPLTRRRDFHATVREFVPWVETLDGEPLDHALQADTDSSTS